jgi:hypothetical protein
LKIDEKGFSEILKARSQISPSITRPRHREGNLAIAEGIHLGARSSMPHIVLSSTA